MHSDVRRRTSHRGRRSGGRWSRVVVEEVVEVVEVVEEEEMEEEEVEMEVLVVEVVVLVLESKSNAV